MVRKIREGEEEDNRKSKGKRGNKMPEKERETHEKRKREKESMRE